MIRRLDAWLDRWEAEDLIDGIRKWWRRALDAVGPQQ